MRLRRGLRVLRTGPAEVQIGIDPRWAVRLRGLTGAQCTALVQGSERALGPVIPPRVLSDLDRLGLTRTATRREAVLAPRLAPDARAYALTEGVEARDILRRRAAATIEVQGLGRTGVLIASTLAAAGIGTLRLTDRRMVTDSDLGTGLPSEEVGRRRETAVARLVRVSAPGTRAGSTDRWGTDPTAVVTVSTDATDPEHSLRLMSAGVPHLPVVLREADAMVGPFAVPGAPCCLRCVELTRADHDPDWPRLLALLCSGDRVAAEPIALATVTAGLAAAEVLRQVDGGRPVTLGRGYELAVPSMEPRLRVWAAHPDCGCAALPTRDEQA